MSETSIKIFERFYSKCFKKSKYISSTGHAVNTRDTFLTIIVTHMQRVKGIIYLGIPVTKTYLYSGDGKLIVDGTALVNILIGDSMSPFLLPILE